METEGNEITIGNKYVARKFVLADGALSTAAVLNRRAELSVVPGPDSREFCVKLFDERENHDLDISTLDRSAWTIEADSWAIDGDVNGRPECLIDDNI